MRLATVAGFGMLLLGCAVGPPYYTGSVPADAPDVFDCALQELGSMGYTVAAEDRDVGYIGATQQTSVAGNSRVAVITVTTFTDPTSEEFTLRVTPTLLSEEIRSGATPADLAPATRGRLEAQSLMAVCLGEEPDEPIILPS